MEKEITLTSETFKALAGEKRVTILKELNQRRKTQSELSQKMGLSAPTIAEHLGLLEKAGLVHAIDEGRKWKYYSLTKKGQEILNPGESRILVLLGTSLIAFLGVASILFGRFFGFLNPLQQGSLARSFGESIPATAPASDILSPLAAGTEEIARSSAVTAGEAVQNTLANEAGREFADITVPQGVAEASNNTTHTFLPNGFQGFSILELSILVIVVLIFGLIIRYYWRYKRPGKQSKI